MGFRQFKRVFPSGFFPFWAQSVKDVGNGERTGHAHLSLFTAMGVPSTFAWNSKTGKWGKLRICGQLFPCSQHRLRLESEKARWESPFKSRIGILIYYCEYIQFTGHTNICENVQYAIFKMAQQLHLNFIFFTLSYPC